MDAAVGLVAQRNNDRAQALAASIVDALEPAGVRSLVDEATAPVFGAAVESVPVAAMNDCALVVSIGGDGTFLFAAREAGDAPILGVNLGEVGFLNAVSPSDAVDTVSELVADLRATGSVDGYDLPRLEATTPDWTLEPAVNEVVVHGPRRGHGGGTTLEIGVDGHTYATSRADGVLVATPTGSTAYNLSEGGPLVRPSVDALVVTQMSAADPMPPLVVDGEIELRVAGSDTAYAISDGRDRRELEPPETVTITLADDPVTVAGPRGNFFDALDKLD